MAAKFLAGALLGLVTGLLLAPEKGETTRQNLASSAEKWKEKLDRMAGRSNYNIDDLRSFLQTNITGLSSDVKHRILTIIDEATDMAYSAKTNVGNGVA